MALRADAVQVDCGGAVLHAAIKVRQKGVPAGMGTVDATTRLRDGQRVLVEGNQGGVVLLALLEEALR
ncbi:MAG: hypothetical protein HY690_03565 [Chloroflexi bacterium]|nr:hypothetical protein [Chloroflexota bacterium]